MLVETRLMSKIFSEATPDQFKEAVSDKIDEAKKEGVSYLKDASGNDLELRKEGDKVVITDKANEGEKTVAGENPDGTTNLEPKQESKSYSDHKSKSAPDVVVSRSQGEDGTWTSDTAPDVKVSVESSITDSDKAGYDKEFSLVFSGFESEYDAYRYFSDLFEGTLTFSEDEVAAVSEEADKLQEIAERLQGTGNPELAAELKEKADQVKSYSKLAENAGWDSSELQDLCKYYSDFAEAHMTASISDMSVHQFFSELDPEEANEMFSELDYVEQQVIYSILDSYEDRTFSEADAIANAIKEEQALNTPVSDHLENSSEEEVEKVMSCLTDSELRCMSDTLEAYPDATFSEINDLFSVLNSDIQDVFYSMDDSELENYIYSLYDDELDVLFSMLSDDYGTYTFSDFEDYLFESRDFSEDEKVEQIADNATELTKAVDDLKQTKDPELAKQVKVLADTVSQDAEKAAEAGHDTKEVQAAMKEFSDLADHVMEEAGVKDEDRNDEIVTNVVHDLPNELKESTENKSYVFEDQDEMKLFSRSSDSSSNPFLTSRIN